MNEKGKRGRKEREGGRERAREGAMEGGRDRVRVRISDH